ncbi:MAG: hypothetical protein MMC33_005682 [Icmadophila ericetorum]|nr:hypothetical protein [Icmadophila ericetorum]
MASSSNIGSPISNTSPHSLPIWLGRQAYQGLCSPARNCPSCEATTSAFNRFDTLINELEVPVTQKKSQNRNEVLWWSSLAGFQCLFTNTIVAIVFLVQAASQRKPLGGKMGWFAASLIVTTVLAVVASWIWLRKRNDRLAEDEKLKEELEKWKRTLKSFCRDHGKREMRVEAQKQRLIYKEKREWLAKQQLRQERSVSRGRSSRRQEEDLDQLDEIHPALRQNDSQELRAGFKAPTSPLKMPEAPFNIHPPRSSSVNGQLSQIPSTRITIVTSPTGSDPETARQFRFPLTPSPTSTDLASPPAHITSLDRYVAVEMQKQLLERLRSASQPQYPNISQRDSILPQGEHMAELESAISSIQLSEPARDRIIARNFPEFLGHLADDEISRIAHGSFSEGPSAAPSPRQDPRQDKGKQRAHTPPPSTSQENGKQQAVAYSPTPTPTPQDKGKNRAITPLVGPPTNISKQDKDKSQHHQRPCPLSPYPTQTQTQTQTASFPLSPPPPPPKDIIPSVPSTPSQPSIVLDENGLEAGIEPGSGSGKMRKMWTGAGGRMFGGGGGDGSSGNMASAASRGAAGRRRKGSGSGPEREVREKLSEMGILGPLGVREEEERRGEGELRRN